MTSSIWNSFHLSFSFFCKHQTEHDPTVKPLHEDENEELRRITTEQPVFKVKNSEPAPQFYYQPQPTTVIQQEYVYHTPKEEPAYLQRNTFVPVKQQHDEILVTHQQHTHQHQQPPVLSPKPKQTRIIQKHTFVTNKDNNRPQPPPVSTFVKQESQIYQHPPEQPIPVMHNPEFQSYDDFLSRADVLYPESNPQQVHHIHHHHPQPPEQIGRIPLKDAPTESHPPPQPDESQFPQSKPPTPPPLPPVASTPTSTFTSRGLFDFFL